MRVVPFLFWTILVVALVLPALRRWARPRRLITGELVKDPVCQTYVVRARALSRWRDGEQIYFCSAECLRRYATLT
jgi:YHS domain-containing protein